MRKMKKMHWATAAFYAQVTLFIFMGIVMASTGETL
eukprot:CAMPEP_0116880772 /NCGR_PEP_ID=MMETSP0463-20121206/12757_1 /TAXON_ID=181622 /ORGANISM="Strombidinopsis sp, Strain SopsisLIS2011" /LENGTH=35 /DNA_ID= /DNA_START= /DNA_END= /DNA_ORIENTATION=